MTEHISFQPNQYEAQQPEPQEVPAAAATRAETLLLNPDVQAGMVRWFDTIDAKIADIQNSAEGAVVTPLNDGVAEDGTYATLLVVRSAPEMPGAAIHQRSNRQLLLYAFDVANIANPEFAPDPVMLPRFGGMRRGVQTEPVAVGAYGADMEPAENTLVFDTSVSRILSYCGRDMANLADVRAQLGFEWPASPGTSPEA